MPPLESVLVKHTAQLAVHPTKQPTLAELQMALRELVPLAERSRLGPTSGDLRQALVPRPLTAQRGSLLDDQME